MNTNEIIEKVVDAIEDDSFSPERILGFVNKGMGRVAAALPLPDLVGPHILEAESGGEFIALPEDYHSNLFWARNLTTDAHVEVVRPLTNFLRRFPSVIHESVRWVCPHGSKLYFAGSVFNTSPQQIRVFYSSRPEELFLGDDIPYIDPSFHEDLLVNFATAECYNLIETGIEGVKVNFNKFMGLYTLAIEDYKGMLGLKEENPDFVQDDNLTDDASV